MQPNLPTITSECVRLIPSDFRTVNHRAESCTEETLSAPGSFVMHIDKLDRVAPFRRGTKKNCTGGGCKCARRARRNETN